MKIHPRAQREPTKARILPQDKAPYRNRPAAKPSRDGDGHHRSPQAASSVDAARSDYELQLVTLSALITPLLNTDIEDCTSTLSGLARLIEHNPQFKREAAAMRCFEDSYREIVSVTWRAEIL